MSESEGTPSQLDGKEPLRIYQETPFGDVCDDVFSFSYDGRTTATAARADPVSYTPIISPLSALPATMAETYVWFRFFDHDGPVSDACCESVPPDYPIEHLKTTIFTTRDNYGEPIIANARRDEMEVWKFKSLDIDPRSKQMGELFRNLKFTENEDSDVELVDVYMTIHELQLRKFEPLLIRILPKGKRRREDEDDYLEDARQCKLAHLDPSKLNNPSVYEKLQESKKDRILDDRPQPDNIPPLPLLYSGFGEFDDFISNSVNNHTVFATPREDLETKVDKLVDAMCRLGYEKDKQAKMQDILCRIFAGSQREFKCSSDNGSKASADGHVLASHGGPLWIIKFNASEAQLTSYFLRLALRSVPDVFYGWRLPALGIIIRGRFLSFVGLIMIDKQVRVLHIADPFTSNDSHIGNRRRLYATFKAACRLLDRIEQDAENLVASRPPHISKLDRRLPNVHDLLRVSGDDGQAGRISFRITQELKTGLPGQRLLYLATTDPDRKQILLKFSKRYSKDLHEFCASINRAPKLIGFEELPGGWFGVAMEYFSSANRIVESNSLRAHGQNWLKDIDDVVAAFHAQGYVHGDLRPPNFIVDGDRLFLVDFDWGGIDGQVTFPEARLDPHIRSGRWVTHITKATDKSTVEYTKRYISDTINHVRVPS